MKHLPILLARHLSCLHLVEHPPTSLHNVLCATIHLNLRGTTAISVLVPMFANCRALSLEYLKRSDAHLIRVPA